MADGRLLPGTGPQALFTGASIDAGTVVKEKFWADVATGLPVEGSSSRIRESLTGTTHRFDSVRWEARLETFRPAPRKRAE